MATETLVRDDDYGWTIPIVNSLGQPYDLSGCSLRFVVKNGGSNQADDSDAVFVHYLAVNSSGVVTSSQGLSLVGFATAGVVRQVLSDADKTALGLAGGNWELQMMNAQGKIGTLLSGSFAVTADIARKRTVP